MMSGGGGGGNGGDAKRWLAMVEKLILSRDLNGSKTYAIRAGEADQSLVDHAELILAVADTLIAGESRIRVNTGDLPDWYALLRLVRLTHNPELVATQYSRLAVLLNPIRNRFPYSELAFRLISDAWYVLSDSSRKALYDRELHLSQFGQLGQLGFQLFNQTQSQSQSPQSQSQSQSQSPQHQNHNQNNQTMSFRLHQPHFATQTQRSQLDQQILQEQQQASWCQQFGEEQSSGSSSDWKRTVEEERLINLNNASERVQSSRRFAEQERHVSRSYEASSHRPSKPTPTSEPAHWQSSEPVRQFQSSSRSSEAAQLSLLPSVSQPTRSIQSHAVSKPQAVSKSHLASNSFPVSQPLSTSKAFSMSQPTQKSKPLTVSQPLSNSNSFLMSQPLSNSKPFPVTGSSQKSKPLPMSQSLQNFSNPFRVSQSPQKSNLLPVSQSSQSLLVTPSPLPVFQSLQNSNNPFPMSQPPSSSIPFPASQPPLTSNPFPVSQPPTASKSLPMSQPPPACQSTRPSQPPAASSFPSPVFNSTQSFHPSLVSTTPAPVPPVSTTPSPPLPAPVSQPTQVSNQTPSTEQTPKSGATTTRSDSEPEIQSFWTTCPYCFVLYEYPAMYEESVLQCQTKSCRRAFQAVKVPSPPPVTDEDTYYCCWGFFPIGFKEMISFPVNDLPKSAPMRPSPMKPALTKPSPMKPVLTKPSPMKPGPGKSAPKVYYYDDEVGDDDDDFDSSEEEEEDDDDGDDWRVTETKRRKSVKQSKAKAPAKSKRRKVIVVD